MRKIFDDIIDLLSELFVLKESLVQYSIITFTIALTFCAAVIKYYLGRIAADRRLVNQLERSLSCFETYGCSDAPRFPNCIREEKRAEILTRYSSIPDHRLRFEAQANSSATIEQGKHYEDSRINKIANLVDKATAGCCTTLAISATNKLLKLIDNELPGHRIEMVSSSHGMGSHCFILFDRAGAGDQDLVGIKDEAGIAYPNTENWGRGVLIIDPWAQSLGHGRGVYTLHNYPFDYYLTNLAQTYDSNVDHLRPALPFARP